MKKLMKTVQLIVLVGSVVFLTAVVKHGNVEAAEKSSPENIQIISMAVERAAH